ncbi:MAG: hypothetical protein ACKOOJ_03170 [Actinomycetota bacterium]
MRGCEAAATKNTTRINITPGITIAIGKEATPATTEMTPLPINVKT